MAASLEDESLFNLINVQFTEKVEHASDIIGDWGPFQSRILFFAFLGYLVSPFQIKALIFYAPRINYWCKKPPGFENATLQTCSSYEDPTSKCTKWEYDLSFYQSTMIDQFDLVCDRAWWVSVAQSSFQVGYLISSILVGLISDRFGRLTALKMCVFLSVFAGIGQAFAPNIYVFVIARVINGIAGYGRFMSAYILLFEYAGSCYRAKLATVFELGWAIGAVVQPVLYYFVRDFYNMQIYITAYEAVVSIGLFMMWESPRWLLINGHYEKARHLIITAATQKGKLSAEEIENKLARLKSFLTAESEADRKKQTLFDIYKDSNLLRNFLLLYVIWFSMSFISYGITLNIGDLGGNLFVNVFVTSVASFVVKLILVVIVEGFKRRHFLFVAYVFSSSSYFAMALISVTNSAGIYMTASAFVAYSAMTIFYIINYLYAAEIFPTTVRQIAMGSCGFVSRIAAVSAPFMREVTELTHLSVTLSIFGMLAAISLVTVYFLPETHGEEIPDRIKQTKRRGSHISTAC